MEILWLLPEVCYPLWAKEGGLDGNNLVGLRTII
jgi:hypothetical protein